MTRVKASKGRRAHYFTIAGALGVLIAQGSAGCGGNAEAPPISDAGAGGGPRGGARGVAAPTAGDSSVVGTAGEGGGEGGNMGDASLEGGSAGVASGAAGLNGSAGGNPPSNPFPCNESAPAVGGFVACNQSAEPRERYFRRPTVGICPSGVPREDAVAQGGAGPDYEVNCTHDSDCPGLHEFCSRYEWCATLIPSDVYDCRAGCVSDDDCSDGWACICGELLDPSAPVGLCSPAECKTDSDCLPGFFCVVSRAPFQRPALACQHPEDECAGAECNDQDWNYCTLHSPDGEDVSEHRMCDVLESCGGP